MDFAEMKKPPSINDLLAEFCAKMPAKTPPAGYLNADEFGQRIGKRRSTANLLLVEIFKAGKVNRVKVGKRDYYGPFADA